jgi:hypothetical protein
MMGAKRAQMFFIYNREHGNFEGSVITDSRIFTELLSQQSLGAEHNWQP